VKFHSEKALGLDVFLELHRCEEVSINEDFCTFSSQSWCWLYFLKLFYYIMVGNLNPNFKFGIVHWVLS